MTYRDWDKAQSQTNYKRRYDASQQALARAQYENRVRDECLKIAVGALNWYDNEVDRCRKAFDALGQIEARLAELEEETG